MSARTQLLKRIADAHGNTDWTFDPNSWNAAIEKVIEEAIAEHEQKTWHKYPEIPSPKNWCWVHVENQEREEVAICISKIWYGTNGHKLQGRVIAWRELPAPYQPQEGGEG